MARKKPVLDPFVAYLGVASLEGNAYWPVDVTPDGMVMGRDEAHVLETARRKYGRRARVVRVIVASQEAR